MKFSAPILFILFVFIPYFVWLGRPQTIRGRWRDWSSLTIRLLIVTLLILGLAGAQLVRAADNLAVVFLVDASDSVRQEQLEEAEDFVRQAIEQMDASDQAAVIVFGADALVDRPMSGLAELAPITSIPQPLHTDLAKAIRLGLALFPAGSSRRMILLSDGLATTGDVTKAAQLAAASGVQINVLPLSRPTATTEAMLTEVDAPSRVNEGESFAIDITAESTDNIPAILRVLASGQIIHEETVTLRPGTNHFTLRLQAITQEFARYTVHLNPVEDTYFQNNQLAAFTNIVGPPRVLLVAAEEGIDDENRPIPGDSSQLAAALEASGLALDRVTPAELSPDLAELGNYAGVILVNVNAKELSPRKMGILQSYVRDLGGGLVTVGGPESYGMGGYFGTPLEDTLPVDMQIKDQERFPSVSLAIVIDRSGSMAIQEGGLAKIQLAAEGAVRVVQLLNDFDEISVIPVDTQADQTIGPASGANREQIIGQIRLIGAGGGGIYVRTGLEAASAALALSSNQVKHIILLADGSDSEQKEGVPELIGALAEEGITVSTVSVGAGPDVPWLEEMAALGGGRFHFTDRAANLPQIFTQETTAIQRSYLIEERFFPVLARSPFASNHAIIRTMANSGVSRVPSLQGYVGTSPKATAQVILETHLGDPLLAAWEFGLGRSVAWTSDATGRWGSAWVGWEGFPEFWSAVVRWSLAQGRGANLETDVVFDGKEGRLLIDARDGKGQFLNDLELIANVINPDGDVLNILLPQVGPGRYANNFLPDEEGAYLIRVSGSGEDQDTALSQISGWVLGYSPEYRNLENDPGLLQSVAEATGGRQLSPENGEESARAFEHNLPVNQASRPIWPWLIGLAVFLLPLDIAIRRLVITRRDVDRAWVATLGKVWPDKGEIAERSEQVTRLFEAKKRAGTGEPDVVDPPSTFSPTIQAPDTRNQALKNSTPPLESPGHETPVENASETSLASRLLEARRQQQNDSDED